MKMNVLSAPALLLVLSVLAGCSNPNLGSVAQTPVLGAQETRLVFHWPSRAVFNPSAAGYLTLRLQSPQTHETRFGSAAKDGAGNYTVSLNGLTGGHWDARVFLYDSAASATLLYYAEQDIYLRPGTVNTPELALYSPGSVSGVTVSLAELPDHITFDVAEDDTSFDPDLGLPSAGQSLFLAAVVQGSSTFATDQGVKWSSSDETLATVDDTGRVQTHKAGTVTITAQSRVLSRVSATYPLTILSPLVGTWENFDLDNQDAVARITTTDGVNLTLLITNHGKAARGPLQGAGTQSYWKAAELALPQMAYQSQSNPWTPAPASSLAKGVVILHDQDTLTIDTNDPYDNGHPDGFGRVTLHRVKVFHPAGPVGVTPAAVTNLVVGTQSGPLTFSVDPAVTHAELYFVSSDPTVAGITIGADGAPHIYASSPGTANIFVRNVWDRSAPQTIVPVTVVGN